MITCYIILGFGVINSILILILGHSLIFQINIAMIHPLITNFFLFIFIVPTILIIRYHLSKRKKHAIITLSCCIFIIFVGILPACYLPFSLFDAESQMISNYGNSYLNIDTHLMLTHQCSFWNQIRGIIPPSEIEIEYDIPYLTNATDTFNFDYYRPKIGSGPFPVIISIHGGSWQFGNKGTIDQSNFARYITSQGYVVFDLDYGLYKPGENMNYHLQNQVECIANFTHFLADNASYYNADINRVFLLGRSSGANLAAIVGCGYNSSKFSGIFNQSLTIKGILLYYPPTNLITLKEEAAQSEIALSVPFDDLLNDSLNQIELDQAYIDYSPYYLIQDDAVNIPSIIIFHGTLDHVVPFYGQSYNFKSMALSHERKCILIPITFGEHEFDIYFQGVGGQISTYYAERFLALEAQ